MRAASTWPGLTAVILAGGGGTRLGGRDKPMLAVAGVPMLDRVLGALGGADLRIVVGPVRAGLPAGVRTVREEPPGGGPAAATAAGLALIPSADRAALVGVFAADLPHLTGEAVAVLVDAVTAGVDGAVFVDERGKRQLLCGVWRVHALRAGVERLGDPVGKSMRAVFDGLGVAEVRWEGGGPAPYFDCDTDEDLRRADEQPARGPAAPGAAADGAAADGMSGDRSGVG
ncbi:NTP transferase domain-containing protein [Dactylosporangium sp. NPDC049525]|uniref:molybdenum cofactor guanylyltransferase n=1 Tax=Dactylosporangium sp. NPDC049525 TaxID=3154730 RepID=UPI00341B5893